MDSHQNKLFAEGNMIVTYIIPDFLLSKEIARFAWTWRFARNAMKDYATCWGGKVKALAVKHGMKIFKDPHNAEDQGDLDKFYVIDKNYFEAVRNNRMYRVAGTSNVFRIFWETGIGTWAELRNGWAWTDTPSYYKMVTRKDTMWTNPIPLLKTVCWYNPSLGIKHVEPGEYSFFLRHALEQDHSFTDWVTIKVRLLVFLKGKEDFIHEFDLFNVSSFPTEEQANHLSSSKWFTNSFVCHFNTDDYYKLTKNVDSLEPIEEYFEVCWSWFHKNNWWKGGYIIDGGLLIPGNVSSFACTSSNNSVTVEINEEVTGEMQSAVDDY